MDYLLFSHCWFATPQDVLQADWQDVWHSPQPPLTTVFLISFVFCSSNMICLDVDILIFILLSIICDYLASWICGLVSVIILENSSPLLLQYFFFSLSLTFGILIMHMLQLLKLFHSSCRFCFFPHLLFLPFVFQCGKFIFTSSHSSICFPWPCPVN